VATSDRLEEGQFSQQGPTPWKVQAISLSSASAAPVDYLTSATSGMPQISAQTFLGTFDAQGSFFFVNTVSTPAPVNHLWKVPVAGATKPGTPVDLGTITEDITANVGHIVGVSGSFAYLSAMTMSVGNRPMPTQTRTLQRISIPASGTGNTIAPTTVASVAGTSSIFTSAAGTASKTVYSLATMPSMPGGSPSSSAKLVKSGHTTVLLSVTGMLAGAVSVVATPSGTLYVGVPPKVNMTHHTLVGKSTIYKVK
jgi:hypothetical protein